MANEGSGDLQRRRFGNGAQQRPANPPTRARGGIPSDLAGLIRKAFPEGVVELPADADEIDEDAAYPDLKRELAAIDGALLMYERPPDGGPVWDDEADPCEDPPSDFEHARSYLLLFLALNDNRFHYETEDMIDDEQGTTRVQGTGRIGCTVAISVLAAVALVKFDDMEQLDDGSEILPQVEDRIFDLDFTPVDLESHFRSRMGDEATHALKNLADEIATILAAHRIRVLSKHELVMPVPWLRAGEETLIGADPDATVTVRNAFFFEQL